MSYGSGIQTIIVPLYATDWAGDDVHMHAYKAPDADEGGSVRIVSAHAVNAASTGSGTSFSLALHNYGTGGTAVEGTIAAAIGGTADSAQWTADTPREFTLTAAQAVLDPGEWLVLDKQEDNSSDPTRGVVVINLQHGV